MSAPLALPVVGDRYHLHDRTVEIIQVSAESVTCRLTDPLDPCGPTEFIETLAGFRFLEKRSLERGADFEPAALVCSVPSSG